MERELEEPKTSQFFSVYEKYMLLVGFFGQLTFFIQGIKIVSNKAATDVSLAGFMVGLFSVSSWLVYGFLIKNRTLIIANIIGVIGALFAVISILLYR